MANKPKQEKNYDEPEQKGFWTKTTITLTIAAITLMLILVVINDKEAKKSELMDELCKSKGYDSFVRMEHTSAGEIVQCQKLINEIYKFKEEGECQCLI